MLSPWVTRQGTLCSRHLPQVLHSETHPVTRAMGFVSYIPKGPFLELNALHEPVLHFQYNQGARIDFASISKKVNKFRPASVQSL